MAAIFFSQSKLVWAHFNFHFLTTIFMFPNEISTFSMRADCTEQNLTFFMMIETVLSNVINIFNLLNHVMDQYSAQMANEVKVFII